MAKIIWTEPALSDLDSILDYIALDNSVAAKNLATRIFTKIEQLETHPKMGPRVPEFPKLGYRQIIEPPCRIFYRISDSNIWIVHIMRTEMLLRKTKLTHK